MVNKKQIIKLIIYFFVIVFLFFNLNIFQAFAEDNIKSTLDRNTIAINNFKLDGDFSELKEMGDILNDKKIIALGESTEGASGFYKLKSKVIEYLIQDRGYRVLIVDVNFTEIQTVDDYINGKGEIEDSFLHYWTYKYIKEIPFESYNGFLFVDGINETIGMFDERDTKIEDGDKVILDYYLEILRGQAITIFAILLLIVLTLLWLFKRFKRRKTKPGARYPGSKRW